MILLEVFALTSWTCIQPRTSLYTCIAGIVKLTWLLFTKFSQLQNWYNMSAKDLDPIYQWKDFTAAMCQDTFAAKLEHIQ
ncbi:hypothetical protein FKM82_018228 [Ascaphus truei]